MSSTREVTLGIGGFLDHDTNAAVVVDGRLIAAGQEERSTRRKHDGGFPAQCHRRLPHQSGSPATVRTERMADRHLPLTHHWSSS
jgi:predicted NodU family carbamoyl transferase